MTYVVRVAVALSVLFNVLTGGASNQTFSARNWGWKKQGKANLVWLIDFLFGRDHCAESRSAELCAGSMWFHSRNTKQTVDSSG